MADDPEERAAAKRAIAVALRWEPDDDEAPRVVASGHGSVAERILEIAFANDIKVREDPDLAQILAAVDVDACIPVEAFMAVAEILAHLYRVNAGLTGEARASRP